MFEIRNEGERAEIYLYGIIGVDFWGDGNSAEDFSKQLNELSPKPLDIRIDSGGGDVYEAFAMCSAIQRYEGETVAYIDGLAASAASYIAVVCDRVVMNDYAFLMIHNAWTCCSGNADYLEECIARLRNIDDTIAKIYEKRTAYTLDEIKNLMKAETWFSAESALETGFAQEVVTTEERMAACITSDIAENYKNMPAEIDVIKDSLEPDNQITSHPVSNLDTEENEPEQEASYLLLNGLMFRKEPENVKIQDSLEQTS